MASNHTDDLMTELMNAVRAERELSNDLAQYVGEWIAVRDHDARRPRTHDRQSRRVRCGIARAVPLLGHVGTSAGVRGRR